MIETLLSLKFCPMHSLLKHVCELGARLIDGTRSSRAIAGSRSAARLTNRQNPKIEPM
jgi:hypothetical protein